VPLYEYKCRKCGHQFEKIESMDASTTKKCPKCRAVAERMPAAPAIQFKGTGWYVTDYAGKSAAKSAGEGPDGGGDSKPAEKSASGEAKSADTKSTETKTTGNEGSKKRKK
jgi:putative FmdB family regulatory protein